MHFSASSSILLFYYFYEITCPPCISIYPFVLFQNMCSYSQTSSTGSIKIYSLDECMKIADSANLDMMLAMAQIPAAQANQKAAFGGYLPQVNASMGYSRRLNQLGVGNLILVDLELLQINILRLLLQISLCSMVFLEKLI